MLSAVKTTHIRVVLTYCFSGISYSVELLFIMIFKSTGKMHSMEKPSGACNIPAFFDQDSRREKSDRLFISQGSHFRECFVYRNRFVESPPFEHFPRIRTLEYEGFTLTADTPSSALWEHARAIFTETNAVITVAEIRAMVELQKQGENGFLLTDFRNNIFFAKDATGHVRIVHVRYSKRLSGWGISAWFTTRNESNDDTLKWSKDHSQVIFRRNQ